jgi:hypothetical protein
MATEAPVDTGAAAPAVDAPSVEKVSVVPSFLSFKLNAAYATLVVVLFSQTAAAVKKRSPSDFLKSVLGRPVRVKLNSGTEYRGTKEDFPCVFCY